ncbi:TetR/AcrR family transcriptional regulator [Rhodococcus sp. USK13]|uniref:TetR/AcrR family transcriptional regulator n=1 Tax=Rhodococcus sp. USK13 TaxID=2806442 RepID=UPI001BCE214F|nr:TetR/AcrR family transcriptional regulator [Rhodococcus sp. USK13]
MLDEQEFEVQQSATMCDLPRPIRDPETRRILDAAWWVLERSHFRSLKVRQVLTASNTSASNFYRRFPSKAHLLLALLEDEVHLVEGQLRDRIDPDTSAAEQMEVWLRYNIGILYHQRRAQRARLFVDQTLMELLPDQVTALYGAGDRYLSEIIRHGMNRGELRDGDPLRAAMLVGNLIRGLLTGGSASQSSEDDLVAHVHDFVMRALNPA